MKTGKNYFSILIVFLVLIVGLGFNSAYGQSYTGVLTLDSIPNNANIGDTITFSGTFKLSNGQGISGEKIYIRSDIYHGFDKTLVIVTTDSNGYFSTNWQVTQKVARNGVSLDGNYNIFASYVSADEYRFESNSHILQIRSPTECDPSSGVKFILDNYSKNYKVTDNVKLSGLLVSGNNCVLYDTTVYLINFNTVAATNVGDKLSDRDIIWSKVKTDSNGKFTINWITQGLAKDWSPELYLTILRTNEQVYAKFDTGIVVQRSSTSITLDSFPSSIREGEHTSFSGRVISDVYGIEGHVVYLKDEDPLNEDDLIGTGYVKSDGTFYIEWVAMSTDADDVIDLYAVFEGTGNFRRASTCDSNNTSDWGGKCLNTIPLEILPAIIPSPTQPITPTPSTIQPPVDTSSKYVNYQYYPYTGQEYIKMWHAFDFDTIKIGISPSPDSYDQNVRYVSAVQEGILEWTQTLDQKYGGNWNVSFEVLSKNNPYWKTEPDVIINIISPEIGRTCLTDSYGYYTAGYTTLGTQLPKQAYVCSTIDSKSLPKSSVSATTGHEFAHDIGLLHTWNKAGDRMCSYESGVWTCGSSSKSSHPSDFDIAGVVKLYGIDGWSYPNYYDWNDDKLTANEFLYASKDITSNTPTQPTPTQPTPTQPTPTQPTPTQPTPTQPTPTQPTPTQPTGWQTEPKPTTVVTNTDVYSDKEYYIVNDVIIIQGQTPSKIASVKIRIDDPNGNLVKLIQIPENGLNTFSTSIKIEKMWFTTSGEYIINTWTSRAEPDKDTLTVTIAIPGSQPVKSKIPIWIQNNAKWWADGQIDDNSFTQGLQFLIKEKIIDVKSTSVNSNDPKKIPSWIKNNADWWSQGLISEDDFLKGIEFLVNNGIISTES